MEDNAGGTEENLKTTTLTVGKNSGFDGGLSGVSSAERPRCPGLELEQPKKENIGA